MDYEIAILGKKMIIKNLKKIIYLLKEDNPRLLCPVAHRVRESFLNYFQGAHMRITYLIDFRFFSCN